MHLFITNQTNINFDGLILKYKQNKFNFISRNTFQHYVKNM